MRVLVGSTGFVGSTLNRHRPFDRVFHRSNISELAGCVVDELVCAGLPAQKWHADQHPEEDWVNVNVLAQVLSTVKAKRACLISTIDVFQPPVGVFENSSTLINSTGAYGRNRAWFEFFFQSNFSSSLVLRLPGLFGDGLRKNLIFDLINERTEFIQRVHPSSSFQFIDVHRTWSVIDRANDLGLSLLNVCPEPVTASSVASVFGVNLPKYANPDSPIVRYDVMSDYAHFWGGKDGYFEDSEAVLNCIQTYASEQRKA